MGWRDTLKEIQAGYKAQTWKRKPHCSSRKKERVKMARGPWHEIEVETILKITDKAILFRVDEAEYWIPQSQIEDPDRLDEGDSDFTLLITEWIAGKLGFL